MANTLKLGNGEWANKDGSLLAYNSENDNFKPLPFTVTRASASSRINKLGLIENVTNNIATIDYQGNVNGALLTQPQSTNLITYPVSFGNSYWTKSGATIEGDVNNLGSELITGGLELTDGSGWDSNTGAVTFSSAGAEFNAADDRISETTLLTIGQLYYCEVNVTTNTATNLKIDNNGNPIYKSITGTGVESFQFTAVSTSLRVIQGGAGSVIVASLSIKEVQGFTSPSADYTTSAYKLVEDTSTGGHFVTNATTTVLNATNYTETIFVKAGEITKFGMREAFSDAWITVNLSDGSIIDSNNLVSSKITTLINGWYRISITFLTASTSAAIKAYTLDASYTTGTPNTYNYLGDGASGVYIFGAQVEQLSYPTSLIYNGVEGSTVTRVADQVTNGGNTSVINDSEGVLYFSGNTFSLDTESQITLSSGASPNLVKISLYTNGNIYVLVSNGVQVNTAIDATINHKYALRWGSNTFELYLDGSELLSSTYTTAPLGMDRLNFSGLNLTPYNFYGKTSDLKVYNTALSDAEMITLTTI